MRIARFGILGALVLGAAGCQTDDGGPTSNNTPPLAFVRYINAVPDTNAVTVRFLDQVDYVPLTISNVAYRAMNQGGYQGTEAGSHRFRAFRYDPNVGAGGGAGATTALLHDTTFTFVAGNYYTILHAGYARAGQIPAQKQYILQDDVPASNGSVQVRAINAALGLPAGVANLDLFITDTTTSAIAGAPLISNVAFMVPSAYASFAPDSAAGQFTATGTTTRLGSTLIPYGILGTAAADPVAGSRVAGSVMTAVMFGPSVAGSPAAAAAAPSVIFFADRQPPRTTP